MDVSYPPQPSAWLKYGMFSLFSLFAVVPLAWFGLSVSQLFAELASSASIITFDKGAFRGLGVGIGSAALAYGILHEVIRKLPLTDKITKIISRSALAGIVLAVALPYVVIYPLERYLGAQDYVICDLDSHQWPIYQDIVYTANPLVCLEMIEAKENAD